MIRRLVVVSFVIFLFISCNSGIDVTYTNWSDLDVAQNEPDADAETDADMNTDDMQDYEIKPDADTENDILSDDDTESLDSDLVPDTDEAEMSCENAECSGIGFCFENDGVPECFCGIGYHDEFPDCVKNNSESACDGVICSDHGECFNAGGLLSDPICQCDDGYIPLSLTCLGSFGGDPCDYIDCGPNSECVIAIDASLFECVCKEGFIEEDTGWGCVEDIPDPCESMDCGDHGKCENDNDNIVCKCDLGYLFNGKTCISEDEMTCKDIDCSEHGECLEIKGEFYCRCDDGYYASGLKCLEDTSVECVYDFDCYYQCGMFSGKCVDLKCKCP